MSHVVHLPTPVTASDMLAETSLAVCGIPQVAQSGQCQRELLQKVCIRCAQLRLLKMARLSFEPMVVHCH